MMVCCHGDGFSSIYLHMTHYIVSAGQYVNQGQVIGYMGSTGASTGPHLHFEVIKNGVKVNGRPVTICAIEPEDEIDLGGLTMHLEPISAEPDPKKGDIIISKCTKCGEIRRCRAAHEAKVQPDDLMLIIRLTARGKADRPKR